MNTEKIINEWFYRLPNGYANYPYSDEELTILHKVLEENDFQLDQAFLDAKPVEEPEKPINEDLDLEPLLAAAEAISEKKAGYFQMFLGNLPEGKVTTAMYDYLNNISQADLETFMEKLYSRKNPEETFDIEAGIETDIFHLDAKGIGKGELYCAWIFFDSVIQGGSESFDVNIDNIKYEVKDYSGPKAKEGETERGNPSAIRVGVEGSVTKFSFWDQILETVKKVKKIQSTTPDIWKLLPGYDEDSPSADWAALFREPIISINNKGKETTSYSLKDYIVDRVEQKMKIVTGEFNKTDTNNFIKFYATMNKILTDTTSTDINQLSARGPNQKPISIIIDPVSLENIPEKGEFTVNVLDSQGGATPESVINYFKELAYVRQPEKFEQDLNAAVAEIITEGQADYWMVFRGTASNIKAKIISKARAEDFTYSTISQNGIKFIEPKE